MKLLICTQALDREDSNLGFFHRWVEVFAQHCERVTVICLREGSHALPANVVVLSLGKSSARASGLGARLVYAFRFYRYIRAYNNEYNAVLVHMNPEYIVLGGWLWRRWGKRVGLWYAHKSVTHKLRFAMRYIDRVFTSSASGFRIPSPKVAVVGQGIDTSLFAPAIPLESAELRFVTTGRVAESKHLVEILQMFDVLWERGEKFSLDIVGAPTTPQEQAYAARLAQEIAKRPYAQAVRLAGPLPHRDLPALLRQKDIFLNFSTTGSMDKAVLEALSTGVPAFSTNEAFRSLLEPHGLFVPTLASNATAEALEQFLRTANRPAVATTLRNKVAAEHSLTELVGKILAGLV